MDILKAAADWNRAEILSSSFFVLVGVGFLLASFGFWQVGKTEVARAYIVPTLVAGSLLLIIGLGLLIQSYERVTGFPTAHTNDASQFLMSELQRVDRVLAEYRIVAFRIIPLIMILCAFLFMYVDGPIWRAGFVTTLAMMAVILMVDSNANARLLEYKATLQAASKAMPAS